MNVKFTLYMEYVKFTLYMEFINAVSALKIHYCNSNKTCINETTINLNYKYNFKKKTVVKTQKKELH